MSAIELGSEIENITAKVRGIVIARIEYLDGSIAYLAQPTSDTNGQVVPIIEVQEAYAVRVGDGVRVDPKPPLGFRARREN